MSANPEEPWHPMDQVPESESPSAPKLVRGREAEPAPAERDLPFLASFEAQPDLAERHEEILRSEMGR
ncbi:hypothetical protein [Microbispora siamensis]|uniref:hypothetical protein n=1 Tax=Microbispora siamensis TaxID=564413 RepID=UPI00195242A8|nr:hypothetical protein [Microbispora siamensis]